MDQIQTGGFELLLMPSFCLLHEPATTRCSSSASDISLAIWTQWKCFFLKEEEIYGAPIWPTCDLDNSDFSVTTCKCYRLCVATEFPSIYLTAGLYNYVWENRGEGRKQDFELTWTTSDLKIIHINKLNCTYVCKLFSYPFHACFWWVAGVFSSPYAPI